MGIAEQLAALEATVVSADGGIKARLSDRSRIRVAIRPDRYRDYVETDLERQLAGLLKSLWDERQAQYERIVTAAGINVLVTDQIASPRRRRFAENRAAIRASGTSAKRYVAIRTTGMNDWSVRVRSGTIAMLPREEFEAELLSALAAVMADNRAQLATLHVSHFGLADADRNT